MNRQDFETGVILALVSPPVPHVVRPVPKGDVLDNEWPIEWTMRGTADNKAYIHGVMSMRKISDAVDFDYAKAAVTVTALPDSGGEVVFTTKNIGVTNWDLGVLIYIQCTYNGTTYVLGLSVVEKPGTFGNVEFEKGTYFAFMDSSYQSIQFSDADVRFKMTAPLPTSYSYNGVILPALPEWDREEYPYAFIRTVTSSATGYYELYVFKTQPAWFKLFLSNNYGVEDGNTYLKAVDYQYATDDDWGYAPLSERTSGGYLTESNFESIFWSNYDVVNVDNSLYLAASDPIPVYE